MEIYLGETVDDIVDEMGECSDNADLICRINDWYLRLRSAISGERKFFNHGEMPHYKEV